MNVERRGWIDAVGSGHASVRLAASCSNCSGCAGRCSLLGAGVVSAERIELPLNLFDAAPAIGRPVRLYLSESAVLQQARSGYGLPLTGLVLGAACGHAVAIAFAAAPDPVAAAFAAMGTLAGMRASKRALPLPCRVAPADSSDSAAQVVSSIVRNHEDYIP